MSYKCICTRFISFSNVTRADFHGIRYVSIYKRSIVSTSIDINSEVRNAIENRLPIVALESTISM